MPGRLHYSLPVRPLAHIHFRAGALPPNTSPADVTRPGPWASHDADENHDFQLSTPHVVTLTLLFEIGPAGRPDRTITLERRVGDIAANPVAVWNQFTPNSTVIGSSNSSFAGPAYELNAVTPAELNAIFDAKEAGQLRVRASAEIARFQFYDLMLREFTSTAPGIETFAAPSSSAAAELEGSVMVAPNSAVRHRVLTTWVRDIGVELVSWLIAENLVRQPQLHGPDLEPFAEVRLDLRFLVREGMAAGDRDAFARLAAAATFTSLYQASNDQGAVRNLLAVPRFSGLLRQFFLNYVDLSRGERVAEHIRTRAMDVANEQTHRIIKALQLAIDERMVTANHWPQHREVEPEHHQRIMSLVLGDIHGHHVLGTPVGVFRDLSLTEDDSLRFLLATGVGHCGEHANVSYTIITQLIDADSRMRAKLRNVIYSGRANVDHAFVLVGVNADVVLSIIPRSPGLLVDGSGRALVLDLAALHARAAAHPPLAGEVDVGFFLDPYLDPSAHRETNDPQHPERNSTLRTLLRLIQHGVRAGRRTGFVGYAAQYPEPRPAVVTVRTPSDNPANI